MSLYVPSKRTLFSLTRVGVCARNCDQRAHNDQKASLHLKVETQVSKTTRSLIEVLLFTDETLDYNIWHFLFVL